MRGRVNPRPPVPASEAIRERGRGSVGSGARGCRASLLPPSPSGMRRGPRVADYSTRHFFDEMQPS